MTNLKLVGRAVPRHDARAKARGEQLYSDDHYMPGQLYAMVRRSDYPAAILKSVDTSRALALPGVAAVLTAADVPQNEDITKFGQMRDVGGGFEGLYKVLADVGHKIRSRGEAIALVAAESEAIAREACALIEIEYQLPANLPLEGGIFDPRKAVFADSYLVSSEDDSNLVMHAKVEQGDVEAAWESCAFIVENDYETTPHDHAYLETEGGMGWLDENGVITLRVGTQVLEHYRTVAKVLGLPHNMVRNLGVPMGGGFGGKEDITVETFIALLVQATRRPVKMVWSREESLRYHAKRHPEYLHYKTGVDAEGHILAQQVSIIMDSGAYTYLTPWVQMYSTINATGCYRIPDLLCQSDSYFTNNIFSSANRGFGVPQVNFASERQMDEIAHHLHLSPYEVRRRNVLRNGDPIATGFIPEGHVALEELLDRVWAKLIDPKLSKAPADGGKRLPDGRLFGQGLACGMMGYGRLCFLHDSSRVQIRLELDGSVTLLAGVPDLGGGQSSVLAQICAEELGLEMEDVHPFIMDTHLTPLCGTTTATRQLYMSGNACLKTVRVLKERLAKKAAEMLTVPYGVPPLVQPEQITFHGRRVFYTPDPRHGLDFRTVVAAISEEGGELFYEGQFNAPFTEVPDLANIKGQILPDLTYTCHGVEVAVDELTGEYEILRIIAAIDAGKAVNRHSVEGQLQGGTIYNLGWLKEDLHWRQGAVLNDTLTTYLIPTAVDAPDMELIVLESRGGLGPYGAKGVGEPSDNSIAPAAVNAISDAIGKSFYTNHVTPEDVLMALRGE